MKRTMRERSLTLLLLFCLAVAVSAHKHVCHHDEYQKKVKMVSIGRDYNAMPAWRRILAVTEHQYRIFIDYNRGDTWINQADNQKLITQYNYCKRLINTAAQYFMNATKVTSEDQLTVEAISCNNVQFPGVTKATDLYVVVDTINNAQSSAFATAYACANETTTQRPVTGVFELNLAFIVNTKSNFLLYVPTFVHEMAHIVFFASDRFGGYRKNGQIRTDIVSKGVSFAGETRDLIVAPEVLDFAKTYFNNPNLQGVPLENGGGQGSAGSHWEKAFMPMEYMNPSVEQPGIMSEFTLRLMQASGWYSTVDLTFTMPYEWMKGQSSFNTIACPTTAEYCTSQGAASCSPDYLSKATCTGFSNFMGDCKYKANDGKYCVKDAPTDMKPEASEFYGFNSRCIMMNGPKCLKSSCDANNQVTFTIGQGAGQANVTATCNNNGATVMVGSQALTCPADLAVFCSKLNNACPNDCSGFGLCLQGKKCFCIDGYTGNDCSNNVGGEVSTVLPPVPSKQDSLGGIIKVAVAFLVLQFFAI